MAKHNQRDLAGRFARMGESVADNVRNASAEDVRDGMSEPGGYDATQGRSKASWAPHVSAQETAWGPDGHRRAIIIDAATGQQMAEVAHNDLRQLLGRTPGHLTEHLLPGEHDAESYLANGF